MLPAYVWENFLDVLAGLRAHGFAFRSDWYEAQAEFRFPFCGEVEYEGVRRPFGHLRQRVSAELAADVVD